VTRITFARSRRAPALASPEIMHPVKNRFLLRLKNEGANLAIRNAPFELGRADLRPRGAHGRAQLAAGLAWLWRWRRTSRRKEIERGRPRSPPRGVVSLKIAISQ
jgi:hypothetical protein